MESGFTDFLFQFFILVLTLVFSTYQALNTDYKEEESDLTKQKEGSQHLVHGTRDSTAPLYVSNA